MESLCTVVLWNSNHCLKDKQVCCYHNVHHCTLTISMLNYSIVLQYRLGHTYIIRHYSPSVRITAQLLTAIMLCALILYVGGGTCSLTTTPNDWFWFWLFHVSFIYSQSFCQKSAERKSSKKYIFFSYLFRLIIQHTI